MVGSINLQQAMYTDEYICQASTQHASIHCAQYSGPSRVTLPGITGIRVRYDAFIWQLDIYIRTTPFVQAKVGIPLVQRLIQVRSREKTWQENKPHLYPSVRDVFISLIFDGLIIYARC